MDSFPLTSFTQHNYFKVHSCCSIILGSIPLYGCITDYLYIHLLKGIWYIVSFLLLQIKFL